MATCARKASRNIGLRKLEAKKCGDIKAIMLIYERLVVLARRGNGGEAEKVKAVVW